MGSQNSKFISDQELPHEFRPLKQLPGVYESVLNGTRLQKHKVDLNSEGEISYEKEVFVFRRMHADRVISAHFFQKFMPSHFCNMSYQVCFFTQYPAYSLSLDLAIPTERGFQLLIESLKGFQLLYSKFGPFNIDFHNILFDVHHQPKVWISSDLGKTRVQNNQRQHASQEKMIVDTFKLYDQIKDERSMKITFSNYLRIIKEKQYRVFTFKNVITYMVDEASKFFMSRCKFKECFTVDRTNRETVNGFNNRNCQPKNAELKKSNNPSVISLRTKTRNDSKAPSTAAGGLTSYQSTFKQSGKFAEFKKQYLYQKGKKPKRHNSQEDYCHTREINYYKENNVPLTQQRFWRAGQRPQQQVQHMFKEEKKILDPNTIRVFRRSLDQLDRHIRVPAPQIQQNLTKRPIIRNFNEPIRENRHFHNIMQTQVVKQQSGSHPHPNFMQIKVNIRQNQKHVIFDQQPTKHNASLVQTKPDQPPKWKEQDEFPLMLSNLQTIKSIINSDYSDMDSQIRNDLENMDI